MVDYVLRLRMGNPAPPDPDIPATQTIAFGAKTFKGHGGHALAYEGAGTLSITSQRDDLGSTVSLWSINSSNHLVPSGTYGTAAPSYGRSQYVVEVTDGSTSSTVTVNIEAGVYNYRDVAATDTASSNQMRSATYAAAPGDVVKMRDGSIFNPTAANWTIRRPANAAVLALMTGGVTSVADASWIKITCDTPLGGTIKRLRLDGTTQKHQGLWFEGVNFERLYDGTAFTTDGLLLFGNNTVTTYASYVRISDCYFRSNTTTETQVLGNQVLNGVYGLLCSREIYIHDNIFDGLYSGVNITGNQGTAAEASTPSNIWVIGNTFKNIWNDCRKFSNATPAYSRWNLSFNKKYGTGTPDPIANALHGDFEQRLFSSAIAGTYAFGDHIGNIDVRGVGTSTFSDGQGLYQSLGGSSVTLTGAVIRGYLYVGAFSRAVSLSGCASPTIEWVTALQDQTAGIVNPGGPGTPGLFLLDGTAGSVRFNATFNSVAVTLEGTQTTPTTAGNIADLDETLYAAAFDDPGYGLDNDSLAEIIAAWSMKAGGTLDMATTGAAAHAGAVGTGYVDYVARTTSFPAV